jgi:hypothetical protein
MFCRFLCTPCNYLSCHTCYSLLYRPESKPGLSPGTLCTCHSRHSPYILPSVDLLTRKSIIITLSGMIKDFEFHVKSVLERTHVDLSSAKRHRVSRLHLKKGNFQLLKVRGEFVSGLKQPGKGSGNPNAECLRYRTDRNVVSVL